MPASAASIVPVGATNRHRPAHTGQVASTPIPLRPLSSHNPASRSARRRLWIDQHTRRRGGMDGLGTETSRDIPLSSTNDLVAPFKVKIRDMTQRTLLLAKMEILPPCAVKIPWSDFARYPTRGQRSPDRRAQAADIAAVLGLDQRFTSVISPVAP